MIKFLLQKAVTVKGNELKMSGMHLRAEKTDIQPNARKRFSLTIFDVRGALRSIVSKLPSARREVSLEVGEKFLSQP